MPPHELRQLFEYNKNISCDAELTDYTVNDIVVKSLETFYKKATACGRLKEEEFDSKGEISSFEANAKIIGVRMACNIALN